MLVGPGVYRDSQHLFGQANRTAGGLERVGPSLRSQEESDKKDNYGKYCGDHRRHTADDVPHAHGSPTRRNRGWKHRTCVPLVGVLV